MGIFNRGAAGKAAPAQGMFLKFIMDGNGILFWGSLNCQGQLPFISHSEDVNIKGKKPNKALNDKRW